MSVMCLCVHMCEHVNVCVCLCSFAYDDTKWVCAREYMYLCICEHTRVFFSYFSLSSFLILIFLSFSFSFSLSFSFLFLSLTRVSNLPLSGHTFASALSHLEILWSPTYLPCPYNLHYYIPTTPTLRTYYCAVRSRFASHKILCAALSICEIFCIWIWLFREPFKKGRSVKFCQQGMTIINI